MKTFDELKIKLGELLDANNVNPKSAKAHTVIWAFYMGIYFDRGEELPAGVHIMWLSGRAADLVTMPEKETT